MAKFEIREAHKDDANIISDLILQLGYETPSDKVELLVLDPVNESDEVVVGVMEGSVVGIMSLIYFDYFPSAQRICRITAIVVDAKVRGHGVGKKLIDHAKSQAFTNECCVLEVTTSLKREKTQAFYESIGFERSSYKYVQKLSANFQQIDQGLNLRSQIEIHR